MPHHSSPTGGRDGPAAALSSKEGGALRVPPGQGSWHGGHRDHADGPGILGAKLATAGSTPPPVSTAKWQQQMKQLGCRARTVSPPVLPHGLVAETPGAQPRRIVPMRPRRGTPGRPCGVVPATPPGMAPTIRPRCLPARYRQRRGVSISPGATETEQVGGLPLPNIFSLQLNGKPFATPACAHSPRERLPGLGAVRLLHDLQRRLHPGLAVELRPGLPPGRIGVPKTQPDPYFLLCELRCHPAARIASGAGELLIIARLARPVAAPGGMGQLMSCRPALCSSRSALPSPVLASLVSAPVQAPLGH